MGAERWSFQFEEYKVCDGCGERIPHYTFHLHDRWVHPTLRQRIRDLIVRMLRRDP